jgi:hypothetical protein
LIHAFNWSKMSICAAIGYRWDGRRSRLFFQTREGSYNTESLIAFLDDLKRHLRRQKAILVWDGLPTHKSRAMQEYLLLLCHCIMRDSVEGVFTKWSDLQARRFCKDVSAVERKPLETATMDAA